MDDKKLWDLNFSVEVSARYHEWRRAFLERWVMFVRITSAIGAALALIGLSAGEIDIFGVKINGLQVIGWASATVAMVNIIDFVTGADHAARVHTELYRRFKELQERIARGQNQWEKHIAEWEADAQAIRRDEPPTLWALYMLSWNQAIERRDPKHLKGARKVNLLQSVTKNFIHYLPFKFPESPPRISSGSM